MEQANDVQNSIRAAKDWASTGNLTRAIETILPALEQFLQFAEPEQTATQRAIWSAQLDEPLPQTGVGAEAVLALLRDVVIPHGLRLGLLASQDGSRLRRQRFPRRPISLLLSLARPTSAFMPAISSKRRRCVGWRNCWGLLLPLKASLPVGEQWRTWWDWEQLVNMPLNGLGWTRHAMA